MIASNIVGQVTSFFLIAHGSSEIDIELTGLNPNVCWMTVWYEGKQNPVAIDLPFDASQSWHTYQFDWRPNQIVWSVDGRVVLTRSDIPTTSPDLANYKLEINSWTQVQPETKIAWAGMFNYPGDGRIPQAFYRNMRFQPWDGSSGQAGDGTNGTSGNGSPQQTPHTTPVPADNLQNGKPSSAESSKNPTGFMRVGSTAMVAIAVTFAILF
ncbi:hypothetical protein BGX28_010159 [Mortierella sp. GBA30]|nr:hypothetical protein BGX28_010159 [Mortierella sp. GBA30]